MITSLLFRVMNRWHMIVPISLYFLIPVIIYFFPWCLQYLFFLNFVKIPYQDFTNLTYHGVKAMGRNFYLEGKDDLRLGCWHILPHDVVARHQNSVLSDKQMEQELRNLDNPVVIYFHGNSFDRTESSRCGLYNLLARTGFHVLALDYRGYGDSNGWPSEEGLIEDAVEIFIYAKRLSLSTNIFLWGHSMGTAIATALARELSERGLPPAGLILESPFNNLHDVVTYHPYSVPFRWLPWFEKMILGSLSKSGLDMSTDERITRVDCPILILHAEDDHIIPLKLARKLYKCAHAAYRDVAFKKFDASRKFHHKFIYLADELPGMLTDWLQSSILPLIHCVVSSRLSFFVASKI